MKDLEKIKSEEVAAQVQDANPGNFAIEQEVAAMVGATVPAPTEPSADDARELGAQLLVFLRRALLPIRSALRTALAAIYAHLDSRCTDYTPAAYDPFRLPAGPYDPMRPLTPRTLPNLLTALTAFSDRKIGGVPEAADGMSVIHLMNDTSEITEINDDNEGWTLTKNIFSLFPNLKKWISKVRAVRYYIPTLNTQAFISNKLEELDLSEVEDLTNTTTDGYGTAYSGWFNFANLKRVNLRKLKSFTGCLFWGGKAPEELELPALETAGRGVLQGVSGVKRVIADNLKTCPGYSYNPNLIADCPDLEYATFAGLQSCNMYSTSGAGGTLQNLPKMEHLRLGICNIVTANSWNKDCFRGCGSLIKLEIIGNLNQSLYLNNWSPTLDSSNLQQFLQNFREHIALRLTANGTGKTLTLSQAVRNAIHAAESTYGIENIIVTQKGWTISPAPN